MEKTPRAESKIAVVVAVYVAFLLDNVLLTVVVPILPDYLFAMDNTAGNLLLPTNAENSKVALLLSSKALVQLFANPALGFLINRIGYQLPLLAGSFLLLISSLTFALAEDYIWLLSARSLHGLASAGIAVSGMCAVAENFSAEKERSKMMGLVLGSMALGVLLGYPLGAVLYDLARKSVPFLLVAFLSAICIAFQMKYLDYSKRNCKEILYQLFRNNLEEEAEEMSGGGMLKIMGDRNVLLTAGAIWISTTAIAVLEPCLPLWLMETMHPQKWQLGTVFIPDSLGYLIGTNFFGTLAYKFGFGFLTLVAMALVGVCSFLVSFSSSVMQLCVPHFGVGLGIGVVDATMVPLMAQFVDSTSDETASYGPIYSLQQAAVCLAYFLGPIIGSMGLRAVGFPVLMGLIGTANLCYCFIIPSIGRKSLSADYQKLAA